MISIYVFSQKNLVPEFDGKEVKVQAIPRIGEKIELGESRVTVLDVHHLIHDYHQDPQVKHTYLGSVYTIRVFTE